MEIKEEKPPLLHRDHRFLYIDQKVFTPLIYEGKGEILPHGFNSALISLPSQIHEDLQWDEHLQRAEKMIEQGGRIIWDLDFGITEPEFDFEDELTFYSLQIAVDHFSKEVWPHFKEKTLGVSLYRGTMDLSSHFLWTQNQEENFEKWKEERKRKEQYLFCTEVLIHYLRLFSHRIPDEIPLFAFLDATDSPLARSAFILSQERWEHFFVASDGGPTSMSWNTDTYSSGWMGERNIPKQSEEEKLGVCLPSDEHFKVSYMDKLFDQLLDARIPFRIINESYLSEMWDGLDYILVPKGPIQEIPRRMLEGFCAAGGCVIFEEENLDLSSKLSLKEFLDQQKENGKLLSKIF